MAQTTPHIVLASASPRRFELLTAVGLELTVDAADIDETPHDAELPCAMVERLARGKAAVVAARNGDAVVVAADTAVVLDGIGYSKPVDDADAARMLRALAGRTHEVITGWCVQRQGVVLSGAERTAVTFRGLTTTDIDRWLATGHHRDKAGAYAIQGGAMVFVARIEGSLTNVVGLPVDVVIDAIARLSS